VTIDAIGCQKEIARTIVEKKGYYVPAVKGNKGSLLEDIQLYLDDAIRRGFSGTYDRYVCTEKGHGRIDVRRCWTCEEVGWLIQRHEFAGVKSIAAVEGERTVNGKTSIERRYFISTHSGACAQKIAVFPEPTVSGKIMIP
jgi:predicted transposase YbfD/YdcC